VSSTSNLKTPVSRLTFPQQIGVDVFSLALGYFISYLPGRPWQRRTPAASLPGDDRLDEHCHIAAPVQQAAQDRLAECFR